MSDDLNPSLRSIASKIRGALVYLSVEDRARVLAKVNEELSEERSKIEQALGDADGIIRRAAQLLGVSHRTLQYRMRELGFPPGRAGKPRSPL